MKRIFVEEAQFEIGKVGFDDVDANGQKFDLLNRKGFGQKLSNLVERIDQPMVIALDGGWGSGKSHFLKLWTGEHQKTKNKARVIYFDAFEHDFLDDPLVSLVSRLTSENANKLFGEKAVSEVKKAAFWFVKTAVRVGVAAGTAYITGIVVPPAGDKAVEKTAEVVDGGLDSIDQFWKTETNRIAAMQGFRDALKNLTGEGAEARKIVFIVDELDRCRPDYALSMLETIKHFFAVPNVHFVLGVKLQALECSVEQRYGAGINAAEYLRKFVRLRMSFPSPRADRLELQSSINYFVTIAKRAGIDQYVAQRFAADIRFLYRQRTLGLRDLQQLVSNIAILPSSFFNFSEDPARSLCFLAVLAKVLSPQLYLALLEGAASFEEVCAFLGLPLNQGANFDRETLHRWQLLAALFLDPLPEDLKEVRQREFGEYFFQGRSQADWIRETVREAVDGFEISRIP